MSGRTRRLGTCGAIVLTTPAVSCNRNTPTPLWFCPVTSAQVTTVRLEVTAVARTRRRRTAEGERDLL